MHVSNRAVEAWVACLAGEGSTVAVLLAVHFGTGESERER
jgi:hypothetical protein